jgi:hypothetical protein
MNIKEPEGIALDQLLRQVAPALFAQGRQLPDFFGKALVLGAASFPPDARFVQVDTHRNAVNDVLQQAVQENILSFSEKRWPNAAVSAIRTAPWERLHAFVGTDVLRFLLLKTTLLVPVEGEKGFLQICGPPYNPHQGLKIGHVERWRVFYHAKYIKKAGFEPEHVLFDAPPTQQFANRLCRQIFECQQLHRRYAGVRSLLLEMLHKRVPYGLLLQVLCPLPPAGSAAPTEQPAVIRFVWACLLKLIPSAMFGRDNKKVARSMLSHFVTLRRYEVFDIAPFVDRWRMTASEWIPKTRTPTQFRVHKTMVRQWLTWLMNVVVIPLIRNHFYVTESAVPGHGVRVFYFRKPLWKQLISEAQVEERLHLGPAPTARQFVSARLRLVPKSIHGAMRVVARVMHNKRLRIVLDVLQWELRSNHSHLLGAAVFGFHDVFRRLSAQTGAQQWFFVKVDAKAAFDSIRQDVLCRILSQANIFSRERYCLQRYRVNGKLKTRVMPATDAIRPLELGGGRGVFTDCAWGEFVARKELYDLLFEHIRLHVVQWRGQRFRQQVGIAQGSVLSSLLCALYYGHMERALGLTELPGLLMRWTDDTIFITQQREAAETFVHRLQNDSGAYGLVLGMDKAFSNFPLPGFKLRVDGHFAWCGLLFNTHTLEVSWDYARYEGTHVRDTLTANTSALDKLKQYVAAKCIAVLMSLEINSYDTVLFNMYQMFLLVAMKFHCLGAVEFRVIRDIVDFASLSVRCIHPHPVYYAAMHAFHVILSRVRNRHVALLLRLRQEMDACPEYLKESLAPVPVSDEA